MQDLRRRMLLLGGLLAALWLAVGGADLGAFAPVGRQILVAQPQGTQTQEVAGGPNGWVATWYDGFNTSWNVYATPISTAGVVGPQVTVNTGANGSFPAIAYSASSNK